MKSTNTIDAATHDEEKNQIDYGAIPENYFNYRFQAKTEAFAKKAVKILDSRSAFKNKKKALSK